jgi:hypothetical protein
LQFANRKLQIANQNSTVMKDHKGMRPQDIVVLLAIIAIQREGWDRKGLKPIHRLPFPLNKAIAELLNISTAEISASLYRSAYAGLIADIAYSKNVFSMSMLEFLKFGLKYVFPVHPGALVRGIPTAHSADPLKSQLSFQEEIVWEHADGNVRGQAILPYIVPFRKLLRKTNYCMSFWL